MASLKRLFDGWRPTAVTSVYFAALLSMLFNPVAFQYLIGVRGFDRVFGNATMGSVALREFASAAPPFGAVDPSLLIRLFTIYCLLVLPLCFLAGVACCRWITAGAGRAAGGDCDRQAALSFLGAVSLNALALTAVAVFNKYNLLDLQPVLAGYALQSVPLAIVLATLFYLRRPFLPFAHFRLAVYSSLSAALFVSFLLPPTPLGFVAVFRFAAAFAILLPAVLAALRHAGPESVGGLLPPLAVSCFGLLLAGLSLEACNVLNQRGVYIIDRRLFATGVYAAAIALSIGLAIRARVAGRAPGPAAAPGQGTGTGSQTEPSSGPAPGKASEPVTGPGSGPVTGPEPAPAAGAAPEQVTGPCPDPDAGTAPGAGRGKVWDTVAVAGLLLSLFYFTALPPLQISAGTELFEQAAHGMLVNDALVWGKIPLVESFDAHMLRYSLGMLAYAWLNGDATGGLYFQYDFIWLSLAALFAFLMLRAVFGTDFAFFFLLVTPAVSTMPVSPGAVCVVALLHAMRRGTPSSYLLLFLAVILAVLYEAPVGFSYGGAALLAAFVHAACRRPFPARRVPPRARAFLLSAAAAAAAFAGLYAVLCLSQGVDPLARAREFLGIVQSTNNWAYYVIGDPRTLDYALLYSALPLACAACLFTLLARPGKSADTAVAAAVLLAYFLNFTRAMGRHGLAESQAGLVIWTGVLGMALFAAASLPSVKRLAFVASGVFLTTAVFHPEALLGARPAMQEALSAAGSPATYYEGAAERTRRVDLSAPLATHAPVLGMISKVIPEGGTYVDLTNQTMLYALSGREKPVYVNQSPSYMSGEYTQERFISQIEGFGGRCDFALLFGGRLGVQIDYLKNTYRYYKVYEYLYEGFRPLAQSPDGFALWVRKGEHERYLPLVEGLAPDIEPAGYDYLDSVHNVVLGQIPYVWGQHDDRRAWENPVVEDFDAAGGPWPLPLRSLSFSNYILLEIAAPSAREATLYLSDGEGEPVASFGFSVNRGAGRYLIRASTDWYWNSGRARSFSLDAGQDVTLVAVRILAGD